MKRNFNCSDSLTHFLSHPLEGEMKAKEECIYNGEFQSMVDGDGGGGGEEYGGDETSQFGDKKRRLSNHQVKSLEKIFEVDNKLDPDRKVKVAQDLGLQPRQVAIWFQNRRGRWKTKHLERDYNLLKSNYDTLKQNYHKLEQEKETIIKERTRTLRTTSGEHEFLRFKPHPQYDEDDRKQPQPQQQQHDEAGPSGSHQMPPDWDAYTAFQGLSLRTHYHDVHIQRSLDWQHQSLLGFYARMAPGYEPRPPPTYAVWPPQDPSPPGYDSYEQWRDQFPGS